MGSRRTRAVAAAAAMLLASPLAAEAADVDLAKAPAALESVPMQYRPIWRWWWPVGAVDPKELTAELEAMKASGFGGVEQVLLRNPDDWWSPQFRANTRHAVETATRLGMRFDTTLGPMWPITSKDIDQTSGMQEAIWSAIDLAGPSTYTGPLPQLDDNGLRPRSLVAVTAVKAVTAGLSNPVAGGDVTPVTVDPASAVDLTPKVRGGVLTWEVPPGSWKLVATWMRPTGQRAHGDAETIAAALAESNLPVNLPDLGGRLGPLVPDHFSRTATETTLRDYERTLFGGDMAAVLRRNGGHVFEDSLELAHDTASLPLGGAVQVGRDGCLACNGVFWTPTFLQEFRKRRGYDLTRLLPVVFGAFDLPGDGGRRLRADYHRTIADLLVDNHYQPIREWANARGLKSRAQGYNLLGTDKTHTSAKLELPDVESLDYGDTGDAVAPGSAAAATVMDDYRSVVSAAHISGAREITLEAGANVLGEYDMAVEDYKAIADRAFAAGVTTMALHGFAYRTYQDVYQPWRWPGWSAFNVLFAESWNQTHPAFAQWGGLAGYYGRISAALQSGRPAVDVTVLSTRAGAHAYGTPDTAAAMRAATYTWDRIDEDSLRELPAPEGRRLLPDGPAYRALVVDDVAAISQAAAERILAFARAGVPVVVKGAVPSRGTSYRDAGAEDASIRTAFGALLALRNVRQVETGADVVAALGELGVAADLRRGDLPIVAQHRRTAAGDVWFLYNDSTKRLRGELTFLASGRPYRIDPWTGAATRLGEHRRTGKRSTTVPVALAPGETALVSFNRKARATLHANTADGDAVVRGRSLLVRDTSGGVRRARLSDGRRRTVRLPVLPDPRTIRGPWKLRATTASPDGNRTVDLELPRLADWRDIPQLRHASGTGRYSATVTVPDDWLTARRRVLIDLGRIGGMLELDINGKRAAVPAIGDEPRDVTELLEPGENTVIATVGTTVTNAVVGRAQAGDLRYAPFLKNATQPHGLIGPVKLIPVAEAKLATIPRTCAKRGKRRCTRPRVGGRFVRGGSTRR